MASSAGRCLGPGCVELETEATALFDMRTDPSSPFIEHAPVIHVVRGAGRWLPFLADPAAPPVVCISDWQFERATQRHFWAQALPLVQEACGGGEQLARSLLLVAGDMASAGDDLRGVSSDAVPDLGPFTTCLGTEGAMFFVYGNHDDEVQEPRRNVDGTQQLLPDGAVVPLLRGAGAGEAASTVETAAPMKSLRWKKAPGRSAAVGPEAGTVAVATTAAAADEGAGQGKQGQQGVRPVLRLGGVHGIPSNKQSTTGSMWKKRRRDVYFRQVRQVCSQADIVVLHSNPKLPGQEEVEGPDGLEIFRSFSSGIARLLVHGHMHTKEVATVVDDAKVVVNCDCRVVILLPGVAREDEVAVPVQPATT